MVTGPPPDELELELEELDELELLLLEDELAEELLDEELLDDELDAELPPPHPVNPEKPVNRLAVNSKRAAQETKLGRI